MARYAWLEILCTILFGGGLTALALLYMPWLAPLPGLLTLLLLWFYRDPPRRVPDDPRLVLSPADGKVVGIVRLPAGPDAPPRIQVNIFLSVFNVHVNRSPCEAVVTEIDYRRGKFVNALREDSAHLNEMNQLTLNPGGPLPGPMIVRQIAGLLARRIVCTAAAGDRLARGERFGMIKLGSRTELVVPSDPRWRVCVQVGQTVHGGLTPILEWTEA